MSIDLRQAIVISRREPTVFVVRPVSIAPLALAAAALLPVVVSPAACAMSEDAFQE